MDKFELVSEYNPTGDQPEAIAKLTEGIKRGLFDGNNHKIIGSYINVVSTDANAANKNQCFDFIL